MKHKQTRTHGEFRDFIDVYLAEMDTKQSSSTISSFDGTHFLCTLCLNVHNYINEKFFLRIMEVYILKYTLHFPSIVIRFLI